MTRARVIPVLLINEESLEKTVKFARPRYIGDPRNAIRIFNQKQTDEIIVIDYTANNPDFKLIEQLAGQCFMPLAYGGGITTINDVDKIISMGVEKVSLNQTCTGDNRLLEDISKKYGSSATIASIDIKKNIFNKPKVYICNGKKQLKVDPLVYAKELVERGAGEILLTSIDKEGGMTGYDWDVVENISVNVSVPVIANGGASSVEDIRRVLNECKASAAACGSLFVYTGVHKAVLISYLAPEVIDELSK